MFMGLMVSWAWIVEGLSRAKLECSNVTKDNFPCLVRFPAWQGKNKTGFKQLLDDFPMIS